MSEILMTWLNTEVDLSKKIEHMEEDFSNGYLLGELLYKFNQLTNIKEFQDSNDRKSKIKNFNLLYDVFRRIKVDFTPTTAEHIMNCKRGEIPRLLYKIRSKLEKKGVSLDNLSIKRSDHLTALYSSMKFTKEISAYDKFNKKFFDEQLQKKIKSQKEIDLENHLAKFEKFKEIEDVKIQRDMIHAELSKQLEVDERRKQMKSELARFHAFQQQFEQRGIDDWKRNMINKKELERNDLNFQLREAEKYQAIVSKSIKAGEMTLKKNIEQFEKNQKIAAAEEMNSSIDTQITGGNFSIKNFKKVNDFSNKLRETILQRIMNDQATKTERSRRRRKIIVEQSKAQFEIENRRKEEQYIQKLYKQSNQEKQLSYETFRVMQIKNVIIENRNLIEFMYKDRKESDEGDLKENEINFLKFHMDYFKHELEKEEMIRKDLQIATRQKIRSNNTEVCKRMTDLIIDIAEEAYIYQQTNDTEDIDARVWREWTQLFINDQPLSSGNLQDNYEENIFGNKTDENEIKDEIIENVLSPYMMSNYNTKYCQTYYSAYTNETGYSSLDKILDNCEFYDYINFLGQWSKDLVPQTAFVTINLNDIMDYNTPAVNQLTTVKNNKNVQPQGKANTEDQYKEEEPDNLIIPKDNIINPYFGDLIDNLIDIKYGEEVKTQRNFVFSHIPIKISLIGPDFAGKKTQAKILSENYPFKTYNIHEILDKAFDILAESEHGNEMNSSMNKIEMKVLTNSQFEKLGKDKEKDEKRYERIKELAKETKDLLKNGEAVPDRIYVDLLIEFIKIDFPPKKQEEVEEEIVNRVRSKDEIIEKLKKNEEDKEKRPIAYAELEQELNEELMRINLAASKGFVIVNFPNTQNQAKLLENKISSYIDESEKTLTQANKLKENFSLVLDKSKKFVPPSKMIKGGLDYIFLIDVSPQECIRRAFGRRTLASSAKSDSYQTIKEFTRQNKNSEIFHLEDNSPETNSNFCERLVKIEDQKNSESSLITRHISFENTIKSIIELYEQFGLEKYKLKMFNIIDGQKNKDSVTQDLIEYLNKLVEINQKRDQEIASSKQNDSDDEDYNNKSDDNTSVNHLVFNNNEELIIDEENIEFELIKQKKKFENIKNTLNKDLCEILVKIWSRLYANYVKECKSIFKFLRLQRDSIGINFNIVSQKFIEFLKRPSKKQIILLDFQLKYNKFMDDYPDLIDDPQVKEEHHQEVDDLNDKIYEIIESRKNEAIEERKKIMTSGWIENEMEKFYLNLERLYQTEIDKFLGSLQIINDYYHNLDNRPLIELPFHTIDIIKEEIDPTPLESENDPTIFPKLEKLYKTALKVQFHYGEALILAEKKRIEKLQEANKKTKPIAKQKGAPTTIEIEEKKEIYQHEEEMKLAIKIEKAKYRYRVTLIKYWGIKCLKNMRKTANTIYSKIEDWIILAIKAENEALTQLTNILKSHIEKEKKIKYELELDTFDILINMDIQNYIELPPKQLPAREIIDHFKFNINQLRILLDELKPYEVNDHQIRSSTLIEILLKKYISSRNDNDVYYGIPTALKKLSFQNYFKFIKHLDPNHTDFINLRCLGTYFSILNCVICSSLDEMAIKEQCGNNKINKDEFIKLKMWFDESEESTTLPNHENFNRATKLKEIMFDVNKDGEDMIDINEICKIFTLKSIQIDNEKFTNKTYYQVIFF